MGSQPGDSHVDRSFAEMRGLGVVFFYLPGEEAILIKLGIQGQNLLAVPASMPENEHELPSPRRVPEGRTFRVLMFQDRAQNLYAKSYRLAIREAARWQ